MFEAINWSSIFAVEIPVLEIFIRGTVVYLALFLMLRLIMRRQTGGVGITDILVIVMIADASQNAMAGEYRTVPDGIMLVATIMFWDFFINWLAFHFPWFSKLIDPKPIPLIRHGRILRQNLRRELITQEELESQLRLLGIETHKNVKCAYMESDGKISAITYTKKPEDTSTRKKNTEPKA